MKKFKVPSLRRIKTLRISKPGPDKKNGTKAYLDLYLLGKQRDLRLSEANGLEKRSRAVKENLAELNSQINTLENKLKKTTVNQDKKPDNFKKVTLEY